MSGICIAGRAGSGKSPLARLVVHHLAEFHSTNARKLSFADAIKQEVWELYGIRKDDVGGRETLIRHGEERRSLDPTYWVRRLMPSIERCWNEGVIPVVDDVRREPEYARLTYENFYRVRLVAPARLRAAALLRAGLDPAFAASEDPTERDHEVWMYEMRRVMLHTPLDFDHAAKTVCKRALAFLSSLSHTPSSPPLYTVQAP